ncbi:MAG: bifunctional ADP-heptose synthase [Bacteroidales bacterium]|nr:bifunctional ADP-heptose synthase [Bacteroidales bacterium]
MLTSENIDQLFENFSHLNVLVIGDVMVDAYIWGQVDRICPEAPVPIVMVKERENRLGGAANVGLNLKALGANPILCSVIGADQKGNEFKQLVQDAGMSLDGLISDAGRITTTKFRIIGNQHQMLRVDEETTEPLNQHQFDLLNDRILSLFQENEIHVVVFQDYDKGVISPRLINSVVTEAHNRKIPVAVDPKKRNFLDYKKVTLFKPNLKEVKEGLGVNFDPRNNEQLEMVIAQLQDKLQAKMVLNTLSELGVFISWETKGVYESRLIRAHRRNITDVSGAGDTVISVAALCLALDAEPGLMAAIANLAGGLVCEEVGVVPVNKDKLREEVAKMMTS